MDTGQEIEYEAITKVCKEYWAEWNAKAEQGARLKRGGAQSSR